MPRLLNFLRCAALIGILPWASFAFASQPKDGECLQDQRKELPVGIQSQILKADGVESLMPLELENSKVHLIAAVILPAWYFCPGSLNQDAPRRLIFWKKSGVTWRKIGSNDHAFWPIAVAGWARVNLSVDQEFIVLSQVTHPIRANIYDNFYFAYEASSSKIVLVKWEAGDLYDPMCCGGGTQEQGEQYERAQAKFGEVSDDDGYEGTFNFKTGLGEIIMHTFAERPKKVEIHGLARGIYIENMPDNMSFRFDKFNFSNP